VVSLAIREDLADIIDQSSHLVDMLGFLPLHHQGGTRRFRMNFDVDIRRFRRNFDVGFSCYECHCLHPT
jgi:hypothetical protein